MQVRVIEETKTELHTRTDDLANTLWELSDAERDSAEAERTAVTQFAGVNSTKVQILAHFACFTSTKVQILTRAGSDRTLSVPLLRLSGAR